MNLDVPVIGILRGIAYDFFGQVMAASFEAGLQAIEVTYNTERAEQIVSDHLPQLPEGKLLGMGTIRNLDEARQAVAVGAMFIVTPNTDSQVIDYAVAHNVPVVAGAFTPTEVYTAWAAGAAMVKVFPCGCIGPDYIRELRGPFDQIPLVAVGGVRLDNIRAYLDAGASAVGVGDSLFGKEALKQRSPLNISKNVKQFLNEVTL